ncbi:MAG: phage tail tape measure protein, partial [Bacillota bacterium]
VSVESLTALAKVASLNGAGISEVADAFKFLGKSMAEAAGGNQDTLAAFGRLGVSIADGAGNLRPLEEVLLDVGEALRNLPDGAQRTAAAMDLLGRGGGSLITTFMQGKQSIQDLMAEAKQLGAVTTQADAEVAGAFQDLQAKIGWAWEGIKRLLAEPIMEALSPILENLLNWIEANPEFIKAKVASLSNAIVNAALLMGQALEHVIANLEKFVGLIGTAMGALGGAATGAWIGSFFGPVGTVVGGVTGLVGGGIAGSNYAHGLFQNPVINNNFTNTFKLDGDGREYKQYSDLVQSVTRSVQLSVSEAARQAVEVGL